MPRNAYHKAHLHSALAASTREPYDLARARYLHPDWKPCRAQCGWPVDPAADPSNDPIHPTCDHDELQEAAT